jgi:hypothetical protein
MNTIYNKLSPKRKYHRTPKCANLAGVCTFEKCRCNYPLMEPETKAKIDEYLHHRQRVIKRRRDIELNKLDNEMDHYCPIWPPESEYKKQYLRRKKYELMAWRVLWILCGLVLLIGVLIN